MNSITVPPVIQAGKEATVYTTVAAKPLPPDIPSLIVKVRQPNEVNSTEIDTAAQIIPSPTNRTEYIILHKFVVPVNVEEMTVAAPRFDLPENWTSTGDISFEPIGVVVIPGETCTRAYTHRVEPVYSGHCVRQPPPYCSHLVLQVAKLHTLIMYLFN